MIIYAALSGPTGGIWRSENTGKTWVNMLPGQATSVVLDADSAGLLNPDANPAANGNLQVVYAALRGTGVFLSPNQGQVWNEMLGNVGNPLIQDLLTGKNVNPAAAPSPNGGQGRITLAVPTPTGIADQDAIYSGWLYAAVANPAGSLFGLFVTKDFGENWTEVTIPSVAPITAGGITHDPAIPSNDISLTNYGIFGGNGGFSAQGNYDQALAVDPTNPNIVYLGGDKSGGDTGLVRIDLTAIWDAHNLTAFGYFSSTDSGALRLASAAQPSLIRSWREPPFG